MYFGIALVFVSTYVYMCCAAATVSHDLDPSTITCSNLCEHIKFTTWTSCENSTRFRYNYICCKNLTRTDCERRCNVSLSLTKAEKISKTCTVNLTTDFSSNTSNTSYGSTSLTFLMTSVQIGSESKTTPIISTRLHETTSSLETTTVSEISSVSVSTTNRGSKGYTEQSSTMTTHEEMKTISPASTMDMPASTDKFMRMASSKVSTTSSLNFTENSSQHSRSERDGDSSSTTSYGSITPSVLMTPTEIRSESKTTPIISTRLHETTMSEVSSESISTTNRGSGGYTEQSSTMSTREVMTTISPASTMDMHASTGTFTTMSSSDQQAELSTATSNLTHKEHSSHHSRIEQDGEQKKKTSTVAIAVGCSLGGVVILAIMIAVVLIWKRMLHGSQISPSTEEEPTELLVENNPDRSVHFEERAD